MSLRPYFCSAMLVLLSVAGFSQVKKGYKFLAEKNYPAARAAFLKQYQHPVYAAGVHTGLVQIRLEEEEKRLDSLFKLADQLYLAAEKWESLSSKSRKKLFKKSKVDTARFRELLTEVERRVLVQYHDSTGILVLDQHLNKFPDTPSFAIFQQREDLRAKMVAWHLKSLKQANYAILDALYNHHYDLLSQRGKRYPDYVYSFILDAFVKEHTYRNLATFVKEQPGHWFSEACWSEQAVEVLHQDSVQLALGFLRQYPYFILDDWMDLHVNRLTNDGLLIDSTEYTPSEWTQIQELSLGWDLMKQLRSGKRTPSYDQDLLRYLQITAPSKRGYDLFRLALSAYQRRAAWDKAIHLLKTTQQLYPDVMPPDCDKRYLFYTSKDEWFKTAIDIMQRPADGFSIELVPGLSQAEREELAPVFSPDGRSLYLALENGRNGLDVFISHFDPQQNLWQTPERVESFSSAADDIPYSITRDGREFLIAQGGKLMMSTYGASDWQKPFGLPLTVNEFPWVGRATLSPDGRCLIFEGSGNKKEAHEVEPPFIHLYRMVKGESRFGWGNPQIMASLIIEGGEERNPSFGPDGNLYFIADRWPGLGQGDVFVTRSTKEDWSEWTKPENLGKEVNTLGDEKHWLSIAPDNTSAIFATDELSKKHESELYSMGLPGIAKAEKRQILNLPVGNIGQHLSPPKRREMVLQIRDAATDQLISEIKPQGESRFIVSLPGSWAKIRYQVFESVKSKVPLTQVGEYVIKPGGLQELPELILLQ